MTNLKQQWGLNIGILVGLLLFLSPKMIWAEDLISAINPDDFCQIEIHNNLVSVYNLFSPTLEKELGDLNSVPDTLRANGEFNLRIPLGSGVKDNWGIFGKIDQKFWGTGESLEFYQDANNLDHINGRLYDLGWQFAKYNLIGLYKTYQFEQLGFKTIITNDFFTCFDYESSNISGQGILDPEASTDRIKVLGTYRKIYQGPTDSLGWGTSISWDTQVELNSGVKMDWNFRNLPGFIYFPSITLQTANVNSLQHTISPIAITGFTRNQNTLIELPIELTGSLLLPVSTEDSIEINLTYSDLFHDYSIGYLHNLKKGLAKVEVSPMMGDITFSYIWMKGRIQLAFAPLNGQWTGIKASLGF